MCKQFFLGPKLHVAVPIQASQQLVLPVGSPPPQGFSFVFVSLLQNWTQGFCWRICHNSICLFYCHLALVFFTKLGKRSKTPITALCRDGVGGVPPLAVIFFPLTFWPVACRDGGGGVPPLAVIKKSVENWPKNSVF